MTTERIKLLARVDGLVREADRLASLHDRAPSWRWLLRRRLARRRDAILLEADAIMREHDRRWPA